MRALLLTVALVCTAAAQVGSAPLITVVDENGVAVPSAWISLEAPPQLPIRCQTDHTGRCQFPNLAPGQYQLRVEKEGFYALQQSSVEMTRTSNIEVAISHLQEVHETVDVHESPLAIDPAQVAAQETISGLDVIDIVYPGTHDYRNVLNFIPGVVQDQFGQPHIAGAQTYQTQTQLDGFNVTQPANGQLLVHVSADAFRSIQVEPSREPAESGKGSAGVLHLNTGIGDDHYRFFATNFIPSIQNKHGWRFNQFLPRFTTSGPILKGRIWYYNAFEGEYNNLVYTALPADQDSDYIWRIGNLSKVQSNITSRNILTSSFLINYLHDQYAFLSPQSPQQTNPQDVETAYISSVKDQHYFNSGELLETGLAFSQYNLRLTPYGTAPYQITPSTAFGNYYLNQHTSATRWQGLANLYLSPHYWHGRHDFKVGTDLDRLSYDAELNRQPISFLTAQVSAQQPADICFTAQQDKDFPCIRYSTFTAALPHEEINSEVSAYFEDRWSVTDRLLIEPGIRFDWDSVVHEGVFSPRLAGTYVLDNSGSTKLSAGIGLVYDATPLFLIARPFAGSREDIFFATDPTCVTTTTCVTPTGPLTTTFSIADNSLEPPRFLNWSLGLEKKLPRAVYLKAEFLRRHGTNGFVYDTRNSTATGDFILLNTREDHYDSFQISLRHNFRDTYTIMGSYTRSRARTNQALDFNVDNPVLSSQQPGPYPWDTPNRFLSWGYLPFFSLPVFHKFELAYSMEARTGFPFSLLNDQHELIGKAGAERFPDYFSLNVQLEKKFHLFHNYWALRGGFDNITGRCNPYVVNNVIDPFHVAPTFAACQGRAFTSRIRLLARK
jgi:TonB dependent receptor-like, beta-barrel/Carboxypeptidase regulatory-like domain